MRAILLPVLAGTALAVLAGCAKQSHASEPGNPAASQPAATHPATNPAPANQPAGTQPVYSQAPTDKAPAAKVPADGARAAAPAAAKLDETKYDHFGAGIAATTKATPIADVVKNPDQFTGKTVAIEATVGAVCPKKGCWMNLGEPAAMHVTFKDYGFFVPLDATGRTAIVEGVLTKGTDTLQFKAAGVAMTKPPAK